MQFDVNIRLYEYCAERREARKLLGYFVWKITILRQKFISFPILGGGGGRRRVRTQPPLGPPLLSQVYGKNNLPMESLYIPSKK